MWCTSAAGLQRALPIPQSTAISQHAAEQRRCIIGSTRAPPPAAAADDDLWLRRLAAAPLAALLLLAPLAADVPAAQAAGSSVQTNVRLQDVESATLKAGLTAATEGRLAEAERLFKLYLITEDPQSASAHSNLGNVHLQMGNPALAAQDFTAAVELAPDAPVPYLNRAIAYESLGVESAAAGDVARAQQLYEQAAADCSRSILLDPAEFTAWFNRGNVDMRLGDYQAALTDFKTAADLAPGLAGYRLRQATLMFQTGDVDGARRTMQGVARKNGRYSEAHACLAAVLWSQGDGERAEEQLVRALEQDPRWGDARWVADNTRWPPALEDAYRRFLALQSDGSA